MPYTVDMISFTIDNNNRSHTGIVYEALGCGIVVTSTRSQAKHNAAIFLYSKGLLKLVHSCGDEYTFIPAYLGTDGALIQCIVTLGGEVTERAWDRIAVWQRFDYSAYAGTSFHNAIKKAGGLEQAFASLFESGFNVL